MADNLKIHFLHTVKPLDVVIFVLVLTVSVLISIFYYKRGLVGADNVEITLKDNVLIYPLTTDNIYTVKGPLGETSIEVKNRAVRILSSPCKEKTCTIGSISKIGESIICLPNNVIVTLKAFKERENDDVLVSY